VNPGLKNSKENCLTWHWLDFGRDQLLSGEAFSFSRWPSYKSGLVVIRSARKHPNDGLLHLICG
jgi:hypothetical protein